MNREDAMKWLAINCAEWPEPYTPDELAGRTPPRSAATPMAKQKYSELLHELWGLEEKVRRKQEQIRAHVNRYDLNK